jgi:hypothetical protein
MKKFLIILVIISVYSCGLSESDKENIRITINLHNIDVKHKFSMDSIQEATNKKINLLGVIPENQWDDHVKIHMAVFKNEWNNPYKIERDYNLTLESYLSYCKTMGYDSKTYIDVLTK